jgi:hypothetical protein
MANDLTIQRTGQLAPRTAADIARAKKRAAEITQGISQPFARVTYKQSRWGVRSQGMDKPLYYLDDKGDRRIEENLDCIILDVAERTAKVFYLEDYDDKKRDAPDCASSNGIVPDPGVPHPQSKHCASCKWNLWGSRRASENRPASRGKECGDYKKLVLVPTGDIENKVDGGPMLLGVPPSSLKAYKTYVDKLAEVGFEPNEVWTRITFVEGMSYPLFDFDCPAVLKPDQKALADKVATEHKSLIERILTAGLEAAEGWDEPVAPAPAPAQPPLTGDGKPESEPKPEPEPEPELPPPPAGVTPEEWQVILQNRKAAEPPPKPRLVEPPPPPPGVSAEEWMLILKARQASSNVIPLPSALPGEPAVRKPAGTRRTKSVSPEPHDSAAEARDTPRSAQSNTPMNPAPAPGNGSGADPEVTAKIAAMVDKLV